MNLNFGWGVFYFGIPYLIALTLTLIVWIFIPSSLVKKSATALVIVETAVFVGSMIHMRMLDDKIDLDDAKDDRARQVGFRADFELKGYSAWALSGPRRVLTLSCERHGFLNKVPVVMTLLQKEVRQHLDAEVIICDSLQLGELPDDFFRGFNELQEIHLTHLYKIPASLDTLPNLRFIYLRFDQIDNYPSVWPKELRKLHIDDTCAIADTQIVFPPIPENLCHLEHLQEIWFPKTTQGGIPKCLRQKKVRIFIGGGDPR